MCYLFIPTHAYVLFIINQNLLIFVIFSYKQSNGDNNSLHEENVSNTTVKG